MSRTDHERRAHEHGALEAELRREVRGEVRFDTASRALYATDASNFRHVPIGVVIPETLDDVVATVAACHAHDAPVLSRGCGTSLSGETVNVAVVIDFSKRLNEILWTDGERRLAACQPGVILDHLRTTANARHGLTFGPDPSTHAYCTIGGMVGNNSCGVHSVQAQFLGEGARTSDNVRELEILTYDGHRMRVGATSQEEFSRIVAEGGRRGAIYGALADLRDRYADLIRARFPDIPRRVSGYNLDELLPEKGFNVARALVGTEGTCVTVLEAVMQLIPDPPARATVVVAYDDIFHAGDHVMDVLAHEPLGLEGVDHLLFEDQVELSIHPARLRMLPEGDGWLLVEMGGESAEEVAERARALCEDLRGKDDAPRAVRLYDDPAEAAALWKVREAGLGATAFPPDGKDHWPGWEDSAVPPERIGPYLRDLKQLYDRHGLRGALYGHLGQGCVHSRISFDLRSPDGLHTYRRFMEEAADLVVSHGGSLSGEHGDGQQRAELLPRMFGEELVEAFREFKSIWDPGWRMNPGKVVDPRPLDADLRLGAGYNPPRPATAFAYAQDGFDFAHAALRCVGVGKCRQPDGEDVMCPSYMVTREEKHSTRGRARLLYEMLQGDVVTDGWRSQEVAEALDLCLSCKGCTSDCPVQVDMPTYKAEFLHHHHKGRLRPRHAYALGLIDQAARVARRAPGLVNLITHAPGTSALAKRAAGLAPEREIPRFARRTLQAWHAARGERNVGGERVLVWPDTFTNHLRPRVGVAAIEALEAAGFHVVLPAGHLCCGRPLYDYGMLTLARRYLRQVLAALREEIRAGTPVVGIEPSCLATFKDELPKMLPHDDDAARLARQCHHFADFLRSKEREVPLPRLSGQALLWGHCHQKATGGMDAEHALLTDMGLEVERLSAGCCGLAGSFGFEADHYDISMACGEQGLFPAVRGASPDTLVVADGFSCSTQIAHGTGRSALHAAEVLRMAVVSA